MRQFAWLVWLMNFFWDKIIFVIKRGQRPDEMKGYRKAKEYSENFLNDHTYQEKIEIIWATLLSGDFPIRETELNRIYRLNSTPLLDQSLKKVKYYVENRFWSLLDVFEIDTWRWRDEDVFNRPSLVTYAAYRKDETIVIIIVSLENQKYTLIKSYEIRKLPLESFLGRQLVYDMSMGFLSI